MLNEIEIPVLVSDEQTLDNVEYPRLFSTTWSTVQYRWDQMTKCPAVNATCRSSFRLRVDNANYGYLSIAFFIYDSFGNVTDTLSQSMASEVKLKPSQPILLTAFESAAFARFRNASHTTSSASMSISFDVPYSVRVNSKVCYRGRFLFDRTIEMARIGFTESSPDGKFEPTDGVEVVA